MQLLILAQDAAAADRARALLSGLSAPGSIAVDCAGAADAHQSRLAQAIQMACVRSRKTPLPVVAFASGLTIPALGYGWSSLIAPQDALRDIPREELARRLLRRMRSLDGEQRACCWTEAVAIARAGRLIGAWEASSSQGRIADEYTPPPDENAHWTRGLCALPSDAQDAPFRALAPCLRGLADRLGEPDAGALPHDEPVALEGCE